MVLSAKWIDRGRSWLPMNVLITAPGAYAA